MSTVSLTGVGPEARWQPCLNKSRSDTVKNVLVVPLGHNARLMNTGLTGLNERIETIHRLNDFLTSIRVKLGNSSSSFFCKMYLSGELLDGLERILGVFLFDRIKPSHVGVNVQQCQRVTSCCTPV